MTVGSKDQTVDFNGRIDWIELVVGFACNCRCRVCSAGAQDQTSRLDRADLEAWLDRGFGWGAKRVWFGGGEPSLHPDLAPAIAFGRALGYQTTRLQTNGLRLAYPAFIERLVESGLTEVSFSIKGGQAATHDAMTQVPGAFDLLRKATDFAVDAGLRVEADVLISKTSLSELELIVEGFADLGVEAFTFWVTSSHASQSHVKDQVPRLDALAEPLGQALDAARRAGVQASSLHTPPCVLAPADRAAYRHAGSYRLLVVVPGGQPFMAEHSPMEGGMYLPECERCSARKSCLGLRQDYLALHGPAGFVPLD